MGKPRWQEFVPATFGKASLPAWTDVRALLIVLWRQGFKRNTRVRFWLSLLEVARKNPAVLEQFLVVLAHNEHFMEYRSVVTQEIEEQLAALPPEPPMATRELQPV